MSRYFARPAADDPLILYRFDDAGRNPHVLGAGGWREAPHALEITMLGATDADEVGIDDARRIAAELGLPTTP